MDWYIGDSKRCRREKANICNSSYPEPMWPMLSNNATVEVWAAISATKRQQIKFDAAFTGIPGSLTHGAFALGTLSAFDTTEESWQSKGR